MIQERIKLARQAAGLSLRESGERTGLSHTAIANYEKGAATPSSDILLKLAGAYGVRVEYFFRQRRVVLGEVAYRKQARAPKKLLSKVYGSVRDQVERFLELQAYLPAPPVTAFAVPDDLGPPWRLWTPSRTWCSRCAPTGAWVRTRSRY